MDVEEIAASVTLARLASRYKKEIVKEDRNTTVLVETGRVIYKGLIRN